MNSFDVKGPRNMGRRCLFSNSGARIADCESRVPLLAGAACCCLVIAICLGGVVVGQEPKNEPAPDPMARARNRMVERHLAERGIKDERVLEAFRTVPRHLFVPPKDRRLAYEDESIPIGEGQTITPVYDVAFMTEALATKATDKVYEVGTGSGYQAAILSRLVKEVYSVEIHESLGKGAAKVLKELKYENAHTRVGDGYAGWPEAAPFDAIIVTCAPEKIPPPLVEQLKDGGRLLIPLGGRYDQAVYLFTKNEGKLDAGKKLKPTLFVPMTGRAQKEAAEGRKKGAASKQD